MKKRIFIKEVKIWMKRNNLKRKTVYVHNGGDLFLHWMLKSDDGHLIDVIARQDFDVFNRECILLTLQPIKKIGKRTFTVDGNSTKKVLLPF